MKRSYTCPKTFTLTPELQQRAMEKYNITAKEVERQFFKMKHREFRRAYHRWDLVWINWLIKCDEDELFKREHKPRSIQEMTDKEKDDAQKSFDEQIARFRNG